MVACRYMPVFLLVSFLLLLLVIFAVRSVVRNAMSGTSRLYDIALKNENDGYFKEAQMGYLSALEEFNSKKFQSSKLKQRISEKLKIMGTVLEYESMKKIRSNG